MSAVYVALSIASCQYAVAKIVPLADGGWSLIPLINPVPFPGWLLLEIATDYSRSGASQALRQDLLAEYRSDSRVKLSIHAGGFVQFSRVGERGLLSGRDPMTRRPRGLGHSTSSIADPPRSGPMFGMTAWGVAEYPRLCPGRQALVFGDEDLYDEFPDSSEVGDAFAIDCWPLPRWALASASISTAHRYLEMPGHPVYADEPFRFSVLDTGNPLMILGLVVTRFHGGFPSSSGATLSGPSDRKGQRALMGVLPPPYSASVPSADYDAAFPGLTEPRAILPITRWLPPTQRSRPWGRRSPVSCEHPDDAT